MLKHFLLMMGTAAVSAPAFSSGNEALQCTLIQDNAIRLACFDKVYAAQFPPQTPPEPAKQPPKSVDLVKTVDKSLAKKEAAIVFSPSDSAGVQPTEALLQTADAYTPLSLMYDLDQNDTRGVLSVREHNPMYLLPAWYNSSPNYRPSRPAEGGGVSGVVFVVVTRG